MMRMAVRSNRWIQESRWLALPLPDSSDMPPVTTTIITATIITIAAARITGAGAIMAVVDTIGVAIITDRVRCMME